MHPLRSTTCLAVELSEDTHMPEMAIRDALREAIREEMLKNDKVFVMGEDVGAYGGSYGVTKGLLEEFGNERIIDTPISELGFVGAGIGAAMAGMKPVVEMFKQRGVNVSEIRVSPTKAILSNITDPNMIRIELAELAPDSQHYQAIQKWH